MSGGDRVISGKRGEYREGSFVLMIMREGNERDILKCH